MNKHCFGVLLGLCVAGCATQPYAVLDGRSVYQSDPRVYGALIVVVDGQWYSDGRERMQLPPGKHYLEIASARHGSRNLQAFEITVEPCTSYELVTRHETPTSTERWQAEIAGEREIPGCR